MEREDGVVRVIGAGEQHFELERFKAVCNFVEVAVDVVLKGFILILDSHFPERLGIFKFRLEILVLVDADLDVVEFLVDFLRLFSVIPERRLAHLVLKFGNLLFLGRDFERLLHLVELFLEFPETGLDIF